MPKFFTVKIKDKQIRISRISLLHFFKLIFRSLLFITGTVLYIIGRFENDDILFGSLERYPAAVIAICMVFIVEMILRFFPSKSESMGCQKQFVFNYRPTEKKELTKEEKKILRKQGNNKGLFLSLFSWILLNLIILRLYSLKIIDSGILLLISLAYSICDMICILFFCPFQEWFLKNKCCNTCRIYNWDYAMMFTPLIVVDNPYAKPMFALAMCLLIRWEICYYLHPERFFEECNKSLSCEMCEEKLCHHKKTLQRFLVEFRKMYQKG